MDLDFENLKLPTYLFSFIIHWFEIMDLIDHVQMQYLFDILQIIYAIKSDKIQTGYKESAQKDILKFVFFLNWPKLLHRQSSSILQDS